MKNKMVKGLVIAGMVSMMLTACGSKESTDRPQNVDTAVNAETTDAIGKTDGVTEVKEESTPKSAAVELTADNFVVDILDDGTAMLTQYSGEAESVVIPSEVDGMTVTVIGEDTFMNHEELKTVVIPDTVIEIREQAFMNCFELENVVMSKKIEKIQTYAFSGAKYHQIELPDTLQEIGYGAFFECKYKQLIIPKSLEKIGEFSFPGSLIEELVIPNNIKIIEKSAFKQSKKLKAVVIEEGVEVIKEEVFARCDMLESVTIPASVTEITNPFNSSDNVTIYTPAGSYAETWAAENGVPCVAQ